MGKSSLLCAKNRIKKVVFLQTGNTLGFQRTKGADRHKYRDIRG